MAQRMGQQQLAVGGAPAGGLPVPPMGPRWDLEMIPELDPVWPGSGPSCPFADEPRTASSAHTLSRDDGERSNTERMNIARMKNGRMVSGRVSSGMTDSWRSTPAVGLQGLDPEVEPNSGAALPRVSAPLDQESGEQHLSEGGPSVEGSAVRGPTAVGGAMDDPAVRQQRGRGRAVRQGRTGQGAPVGGQAMVGQESGGQVVSGQAVGGQAVGGLATTDAAGKRRARVGPRVRALQAAAITPPQREREEAKPRGQAKPDYWTPPGHVPMTRPQEVPYHEYSINLQEITVGAVYPNWECYKLALFRFLVKNNTIAQCPESKPLYHLAVCQHKKEGCRFRIYTRLNAQGYPEVSTLNAFHCCHVQLPLHGPMVRKDARLLKWAAHDILRSNPGMSAQTLQLMLEKRENCVLSYQAVLRLRKSFLDGLDKGVNGDQTWLGAPSEGPVSEAAAAPGTLGALALGQEDTSTTRSSMEAAVQTGSGEKVDRRRLRGAERKPSVCRNCFTREPAPHNKRTCPNPPADPPPGGALDEDDLDPELSDGEGPGGSEEEEEEEGEGHEEGWEKGNDEWNEENLEGWEERHQAQGHEEWNCEGSKDQGFDDGRNKDMGQEQCQEGRNEETEQRSQAERNEEHRGESGGINVQGSDDEGNERQLILEVQGKEESGKGSEVGGKERGKEQGMKVGGHKIHESKQGLLEVVIEESLGPDFVVVLALAAVTSAEKAPEDAAGIAAKEGQLHPPSQENDWTKHRSTGIDASRGSSELDNHMSIRAKLAPPLDPLKETNHSQKGARAAATPPAPPGVIPTPVVGLGQVPQAAQAKGSLPEGASTALGKRRGRPPKWGEAGAELSRGRPRIQHQGLVQGLSDFPLLGSTGQGPLPVGTAGGALPPFVTATQALPSLGTADEALKSALKAHPQAALHAYTSALASLQGSSVGAMTSVNTPGSVALAANPFVAKSASQEAIMHVVRRVWTKLHPETPPLAFDYIGAEELDRVCEAVDVVLRFVQLGVCPPCQGAVGRARADILGCRR